MRTLVVVDMQPYYVDPKAPYIDRVIELISWFRADGSPIIFVEFGYGGGKTVEAVRDTVRRYGNHVTVVKRGIDGGREVLDACRIHGFPTDFVVCGVSVTCCVMDTSDTLVEDRPVEVVMDCTDADDTEQWKGDDRVKANRWFTKEAA